MSEVAVGWTDHHGVRSNGRKEGRKDGYELPDILCGRMAAIRAVLAS